jgi:hypothetical protein
MAIWQQSSISLNSSPSHIGIIASLILIGLPTSTRAEPLVYEGFGYSPSSTLNGQSGGTGWSGAWSGSTQFVLGSGGLGFAGGLPASGNFVMSGADLGNNKDIGRSLAIPLGAPGSTAYFSFLMRPDGVVGQGFDNGTIGLILSAGPITSNDLFVGKPGNGAQHPYVIESVGGAGQQSSTVVPQAGQTVQLVVRVDFGAAIDTFRLFVNPGALEPATPDAIKSDINMSGIGRIYIAGPGAFSVDEIRIGTTFADVVQQSSVPEPGSIVAWLAVAVAGLTYRICRVHGLTPIGDERRAKTPAPLP